VTASVEMIRTLYRYNTWAMERILNAAQGLTLAQLNAPGVAGHGSIRGTLLHLIETHWGWFAEFSGTLPNDRGDAFRADLQRAEDIPALRDRWKRVNSANLAFLNTLNDDDLQRILPQEFEDRAELLPMALWQLLLHVANHGTQHRAEIAAMLTEHGRSPGGQDMLWYLEETIAQSI
jgi:uncharacterized damage-inducible protein DinB